MNREDFMKRLAELLSDVSVSEREEAIQYYNDYFDDAGVGNEQSVIASLGTPEQLAKTIKTGLADGGNAGEFTEKGFSGYEQKKTDEVLDINKSFGAGNEQNSGQGGAQGRNDGWNQGAAQNGSNVWNQGAEQNGNNGWNQGAAQNGNNGWNQDNRNTSQKQDKKPMSGGMIALIVILCICASPFILGLGGGILGVVVGIMGALIGIVVGLGAAAISLMILGVCLFVYGIVIIFGMPLGGLAMMGVGMICVAIGLLFLWITVMICGLLVPAVIRGIVKLFNSIFRKGGVAA